MIQVDRTVNVAVFGIDGEVIGLSRNLSPVVLDRESDKLQHDRSTTSSPLNWKGCREIWMSKKSIGSRPMFSFSKTRALKLPRVGVTRSKVVMSMLFQVVND